MIDGTGQGTGVDVSIGHDDVRIIRGTVEQFRFGVHLFESDASALDRLVVGHNLRGVIVERSSGVQLQRVTASGNVSGGVDVNFSEDVVVRRSSAIDNGFAGFAEVASQGTAYERNTATGNGFAGLSLWFSAGTVLERNVVNGDNQFHGIELTGVEDAHLARNEASRNAEHGIAIDRAGNVLVRNLAVGNLGTGIAAPDGTIDGGRNEAHAQLRRRLHRRRLPAIAGHCPGEDRTTAHPSGVRVAASRRSGDRGAAIGTRRDVPLHGVVDQLRACRRPADLRQRGDAALAHTAGGRGPHRVPVQPGDLHPPAAGRGPVRARSPVLDRGPPFDREFHERFIAVPRRAPTANSSRSCRASRHGRSTGRGRCGRCT